VTGQTSSLKGVSVTHDTVQEFAHEDHDPVMGKDLEEDRGDGPDATHDLGFAISESIGDSTSDDGADRVAER
jgi:hypothetical protein